MASTSTSTSQGDPSFDLIQDEVFANKANLTILRTIMAPAFVDSPQLRGTMTILWSCILTLTACIYTALHLNVPSDASKARNMASKAKWVLIGLLAPEVVLYLACSQYLEARRLVKELNRMARTQKGEDNGCDLEFDIKYGFFVIMGGLEVDVSEIVDKSQDAPRGTLRSGFLRLTKHGVLQLAALGHFIPIPRSKINDKSKADMLQKCLVMTQVCWMATQCIVRKSYGLPLSLLEVHTMIHVGCALVMYFFWMKKPLDMQNPEFIDLQDHQDILALMVQEQFHSRDSDELILYPRAPFIEREMSVKWISPDSSEQLAEEDEYGRPCGIQWIPLDECPATLSVGHALNCGISVVARSATFETRREVYRVERDGYGYLSTDDEDRYQLFVRVIEPTLPTLWLQRYDIIRLSRVVDAIDRIEGPVRLTQLFRPEFRRPRFPNEQYHEAFSFSASNFSYTGASELDPDDIVAFIIRNTILLVLLLVLPALYGGIHLAVAKAGYPYFATPLEARLWGISCIDIIVTMPGFIVLTTVGKLVGSCLTDEDDDADDCVGSVFYKLPGHLLLFLYMFCRLFIVVESFISLRHVPIGVFWTPAWIQMIPHI